MRTHLRTIGFVLVLLLVLGALGLGAWRFAAPSVRAEPPSPVDQAPEDLIQASGELVTAPDVANAEIGVYTYSAKFVCTESLQPGQFWYGAAAPIVQQKTDVLIHNPNAYPLSFYKKAVIAPVENPHQIEQGVAPGKWVRVYLAPDFAFRVDCDDIAKLLTGDPNATFLGTYGVGVTVEGFVVVGIGPQVVAGTNYARYYPLDVTAEYVRSSEFMKKDIHYQPWWRYWWWNLPWRLGYAYQRVLPITAGQNIDCRSALYDALNADASTIQDPLQKQQTLSALQVGKMADPSGEKLTEGSAPALVALIGGCDKITTSAMSIDYVLMSNKGPTDPQSLAPPIRPGCPPCLIRGFLATGTTWRW